MPYKDRTQRLAYQKRWLAERRADWLMTHGPCVTCGSTVALEVDHIDAAQKVTHKVWGWSQARRDAELAKCQVLCKPCHAVKTRTMYPESPHGTHHRYVHYRCRCAACRAAHAETNRSYRARRV